MGSVRPNVQITIKSEYEQQAQIMNGISLISMPHISHFLYPFNKEVQNIYINTVKSGKTRDKCYQIFCRVVPKCFGENVLNVVLCVICTLKNCFILTCSSWAAHMETHTVYTSGVWARSCMNLQNHMSEWLHACPITIIFIVHWSLRITFYNLYILTLTTYFCIASIFNAFKFHTICG